MKGNRETSAKSPNRLIHEKSPYLLQHAHNPVDWYPWSEEAFQKARTEDKPVFLSVGYSTCHWCHVMAHESFEDSRVAALINEAFVPVKVDREERPDIDGVYMAVCQAMTGSGGWPLTIVMTPEGNPFFAATYLPRETRFGRVGLLDLVPRVQNIWATRRAEAVQSASAVAAALRRVEPPSAGARLDAAVLGLAYEQLAAQFDAVHGGFGSAPKFPTPHNLSFLLRYWKRSGEDKALQMVEATLQAMRRGGIYDHLGFGFHRYSTDAAWRVPHFEKMLYDQALLAIAYAEAFQATGNAAYNRTAHEIFTYVLRDMTAPDGAFYSAEDADSEGQEGRFYVWTRDEILDALDERHAPLAITVFNVTPEGNFKGEATGERSGSNILYVSRSPEAQAADTGLSQEELQEQTELARQQMFAHRLHRTHPHKDDKVLTDWNGLMIAALARGAQALGEPRYAEAAARAASFVLDRMRSPSGRLLHRYRLAEAAIPANLDDYAFMIWGMLELYEAGFDPRYLRTALDLNKDLIAHFWDQQNGGFFYSPDDGERLLIRRKDVHDGATPSGNSVAMLNMLRLGRMTASPELEALAAAIGMAFSAAVTNAPGAHTHLMCALDFALGPTAEVVIAGDSSAPDTQSLLQALRTRFIPNKVVLLNPSEEPSPAIHDLAAYTRSQPSVGGQATAYVCHNHQCNLPTTDASQMIDLLSSQTRPTPGQPGVQNPPQTPHFEGGSN